MMRRLGWAFKLAFVIACAASQPAYAAIGYTVLRAIGLGEPTGNLVFTADTANDDQKLLICLSSEDTGVPNWDVVTFTVGGQTYSTELADLNVSNNGTQIFEWDAVKIEAMTGGGTYAISYADDGTAVDTTAWVALLIDETSQAATVVDTNVSNPANTSFVMDNNSVAGDLSIGCANNGDDSTELTSWGTGMTEGGEYKPTTFWAGWAHDTAGGNDPYTWSGGSEFHLGVLMTFSPVAATAPTALRRRRLLQ